MGMAVRVRVLLVDDDAVYRAALGARLRAASYEVVETGDGGEAVRLVRSDRSLDIVVVELAPHGLDGVGVLGEIKKFRPELPVLVLTGSGSVESAVDMGSRGAYRYLEKSADVGLIVAALAEARHEKLRVMARHDMALPTLASARARLWGGHNHRPAVVILGMVLLGLAYLLPPPPGLVALLGAPKSVPAASVAYDDPSAGYAEYREMDQGETIATHYVRRHGTAADRDAAAGATRMVARKAMLMVALLLAAALFWATAAVPIGITAIFVAAVLYAFGIMRPDQVAQAFAKDSVVFIFGVLAMSRVITRTGLDRRLGTVLLAPVRSLPLFLFLFLPAYSLTCSFISESVLVAVVMPLLIAVYATSLRERGIGQDRQLLLLLGLGLCYASNLGGPGSPAAGARNAVMIGILEEYGRMPSFVDWMRYGLPFVPVATLALGLYFALAFRKTVFGVKLNAAASIRRTAVNLGPPNREERITGAVFGGVILLWIAAGPRMGMGGPILLGLVALNLLQVLKWRDVIRIPWEVVFLYAGASAIGKGLASTGGALFLAESAVNTMPESWLQGSGLPLIAALLAGATTNFMSDGATVAAVGPITVPMAQAAGQHPWAVGFATAFASSFAHMLIIGTPSNALVYSLCRDPATGRHLVTQRDFLRHGAAVFVLSFAVLWIWTMLGYWKWLGFPAP
jgi:sodium-dependent dicarboxylate transporter 2/3/5